MNPLKAKLCSSVFLASLVANIALADTVLTGNLSVEGAISSGSSNPAGFIKTATHLIELYSESSTATSLLFTNEANPAPSKKLGYITGEDNGYIFGIKDADNNWSMFTKKDQYVQFRVDNIPMMTIWDDGDVGIGTTGPSHKLDVVGTGRFQNDLNVTVTNGQADFTINSNSSSHDAVFTIKGNENSWVMRNDISRGHALSIRSRSPSDSGEQERIIVQQNGETEFKSEVTIPPGGDLAMGTYTETPPN